jgi:hypothetical protein
MLSKDTTNKRTSSGDNTTAYVGGILNEIL